MLECSVKIARTLIQTGSQMLQILGTRQSSIRFSIRFAQGAGLIAWTALAVVTIQWIDCSRTPAEEKHQYALGDKSVSVPAADEPILEQLSVKKAVDYLELGAAAWTKGRKCVSCHTNGAYLTTRPAMIGVLGKPSQEIREFFVSEMKKLQKQDASKLLNGIKPTQIAYIAQGLAEWDLHVNKSISVETKDALSLLSKVQSKDGSYGNMNCWPPLESSNYHGATVAAMAMATAPGYLSSLDDQQRASYEKLIKYLKQTAPPHDYGRVLLLWTSTRIDGLLSREEQAELVQMIRKHQRPDGGWSLRTFSAAESWGGGNRAGKLRGEPEFANPPSDGHQTGLALIVLLDAGVAANDPQVQSGIAWLKKNQRESGRWWTRSLNNDRFHFITYSGTAYPLLALAKAGALPKP